MSAAETGAENPSTPPGEAGEAAALGEGAAERPILRLRHRRRRRRPPGAGRLLPGTTAAVGLAPAAGAEADLAGGAAAPTEGAASIAASLPRGARSFSAPRRRRRHAPLAGEQPAADADAAAAGGGATSGEAPAARPPRARRRRRPRAAAGAGEVQAATERPPRDRQARRDDREPRSRDVRREGGPGERRDRGDRRDRRGPSGRGRRDAPRPVERKLYSFDSVVDRGFDDVEEEGGETRRVHWTIVKRTTADQVSRKALSANYVLQRDGNDSEFPSLGAARDAVNKTIMHPEKLTRSKAEYAAEKKK